MLQQHTVLLWEQFMPKCCQDTNLLLLVCLLPLWREYILDEHFKTLETARVNGLVHIILLESLILLLHTLVKLCDIRGFEEPSLWAKKFSARFIHHSRMMMILKLVYYWTMGVLIFPIRGNSRGYWVTMWDLLGDEYFSWNNGHSQFLSHPIWEIITTVRIVLKIFDLSIWLRIAHTIYTKVFLKVYILYGRIRVMVCLVIKLML